MTKINPMLAWLVGAIALGLVAAADAHTSTAEIDPCFTPEQSCMPKIVAAIDAARSRILVQSYTFGTGPIAQALAAAHRRGVDVRAILDQSEYERGHSAGAGVLLQAGIPVALDAGPGGFYSIAHTKLLMIDGRLTIGGSYNHTEHSEKNSVEAADFMVSPDLTAQFEQHWLRRSQVAVPLRPGGGASGR